MQFLTTGRKNKYFAGLLIDNVILFCRIGWAVSTGLMEKWKTIHWPRDLWCEDAATYISNTSPKTRKLSLVDLQGTFFLLGAGVIFSICSFMIEKITNIVTLLCIKRI